MCSSPINRGALYVKKINTYAWQIYRQSGSIETNREMEISDSNLVGDSGEVINNRENQDERESRMNHCMISVARIGVACSEESPG